MKLFYTTGKDCKFTRKTSKTCNFVLFFSNYGFAPQLLDFYCFLLDFLTDTYGNIMCTLNESCICIYFIILFFHLSTKQ